MSERRTFVLVDHAVRLRAAAFIVEAAPAGHVVTVQAATKKRAQEEKYHAMIGEIAAQSSYAGRRWGAEDMKRILVDEFADAMRSAGTPLHHDGAGRLIPSEDGRRVIQLGIQTRDFWVAEAAQFIEFLHAWGAQRDVDFCERQTA